MTKNEYMKEYERNRRANPHISKNCASCGALFFTYKSKIIYCTSGCSKKKSMNVVCNHCASEFTIQPWRSSTAKYCSRRCRASANSSGEKHWNWQGGKTEARVRDMRTYKYKDWRKAVFERDNYTCQECGDSTGGNLEADHIKPYSLFPELRYEIDNGRTLCVDCHKKTPTWGKKILTYKKQLMIGERY